VRVTVRERESLKRVQSAKFLEESSKHQSKESSRNFLGCVQKRKPANGKQNKTAFFFILFFLFIVKYIISCFCL